MTKELINAVKQGGADPKSNTRLRLVLQKAKSANLPNEVVERNIKKASSEDQAAYIEMTYELYGYGGVGIIVEVMTDNKNRMASDMRIATNKRGGTIATPGAVSYNFEKKGIIQVLKKEVKEDELFLMASDAGAEDFEASGDCYIITTAPELVYQVKEKLNEKGTVCEEVSLEMVPKALVECDPEAVKNNLALIEWLEGMDDVDAVYHNMNFPQD